MLLLLLMFCNLTAIVYTDRFSMKQTTIKKKNYAEEAQSVYPNCINRSRTHLGIQAQNSGILKEVERCPQ